MFSKKTFTIYNQMAEYVTIYLKYEYFKYYLKYF